MAPITAAANTITPTATPALAPAERPPLCSTVMPEPVGAAAVEAVHAALDETTAHAYPAPQHPPPLHRTWPCAVHPDARGVTSVGVVVSVELVLELELVARQTPVPAALTPQSCVKAQQPLPSEEAHRYLVDVQWRDSHPKTVATVVVPEVVSVVVALTR